jgi:hypothetical protein
LDASRPILVRLAYLWIGLFVASVAFPIVASLIAESARPAWMGPLDVVVAGVTVFVGFLLLGAAGRAIDRSAEARAYRLIRGAASGFLVVLAVFFVAPQAVDWTVLAIGLAWRAWLFVVVTPVIVALVSRSDRA